MHQSQNQTEVEGKADSTMCTATVLYPTNVYHKNYSSKVRIMRLYWIFFCSIRVKSEGLRRMDVQDEGPDCK